MAKYTAAIAFTCVVYVRPYVIYVYLRACALGNMAFEYVEYYRAAM